jgi:ribosomal protein S18 acetylase RimI-like enzyme
VVGFCRGVTDDLSNGYLSMLVVSQEHRLSGIGSRLVRSLVEGEPSVTWVLRAERPGARQFFEKLGFSESVTAMERKREKRHET